MTRLLVFDSGIGGLSVVREIRRTMPGAEIVYVADDDGFPYGAWEAEALAGHVVDLMGQLIERFSPDAVVIACNTASTLVLPPPRARFAVPFVGTVPAIKPAAERTQSGLSAFWRHLGRCGATTRAISFETFAQGCEVRLVGSEHLAPLAESFMRGGSVDDAAILEEIAPAFVEKDGRRTDVVVLACTHYPFLLEPFRRVAPWPVEWIDTAPAIARRTLAVAGESRPVRSAWTGNRIPDIRSALARNPAAPPE